MGKLREYQEEAVAFLLARKRCILALEMGLGKTASAISAATASGATRILVVCPSYVRGVWHNAHDGGELRKWNGDPSIRICEGIKMPKYYTPTSFGENARTGETMFGRTGDFILCHYDILAAWQDALQDWNPEVVIFDEAHFLTNERAGRTKAAAAVARKAEYVWALTGTPLTNRPRDLWGLIGAVRPGALGGSFFRFGVRYCDGHKEQVTPTKIVWDFSGSSNLEELRERLGAFMLRRTKQQVAAELPAKTRQVIWVDALKGKGTSPVASLGDRAALRGALAAAADAKVDAHVLPLLESHLAEGRKVVCATYRRSVAEYLASRLNGALIHGGISHTRREATLARLREQERSSLLCATIDSSSTGIDLSYADVAVCAELTYEPSEKLQWEGRFVRLTTKEPKLIQYICARGTADELVVEAVINKLDILETVVGGFAQSGMASDLRQSEEEIMADLYRGLGL